MPPSGINGENNGARLAQPHGGALRAGGTLGNRGGSGRPPNELRRGLRDILEGGGLKRLEKILVNPKSSDRDVLRALELCLRYGVGLESAEVEAAGASLNVSVIHPRSH